MLIEKPAVCAYCGSQRFVNVKPDVPEEELNLLATQTCDCDGAIAARGMKITEDAVSSLLGVQSLKRGFDHEVDSDTVYRIVELCRHILDGLMDKITLTEPKGDVIKLVKNGNAVKVQRTSKKQIAM